MITTPARRALAPTALRRTPVQQAVDELPKTIATVPKIPPPIVGANVQRPVVLNPEPMVHIVPPERVVELLSKVVASIEALEKAPLPKSRAELVDRYVSLGQAQSRTEAALVTALDALDALAAPDAPSPYRALRQQGFAALSRVGVQYAKLDSSWSELVHGGTGWPAQPVEIMPDRGDGQPLRVYVNTFRSPVPLSYEQRKLEYQKRVDDYEARGGRFESIIEAVPGVFNTLEPMFRYDYVAEYGGPMRLFPNGDDDDAVGAPKPGHSLLLEGGPDFRDARAAIGGELWVLKDAKGELEAVVMANNSGHLKPKFEDLDSARLFAMRLGVPFEKVVLFGGPNNLVAMFRELEEKFPTEMKDLAKRLPSMAAELAELRAAPGVTEQQLWR